MLILWKKKDSDDSYVSIKSWYGNKQFFKIEEDITKYTFIDWKQSL